MRPGIVIVALAVLFGVAMLYVARPLPPAPEPDTMGLVACSPRTRECWFLDLREPPPEGVLLYVPDRWYRELQWKQNALQQTLAGLPEVPMIYVFARRSPPEIEEVVANSEEEARKVLASFSGLNEWELVNVVHMQREQPVSERLSTTEHP